MRFAPVGRLPESKAQKGLDRPEEGQGREPEQPEVAKSSAKRIHGAKVAAECYGPMTLGRRVGWYSGRRCAE